MTFKFQIKESKKSQPLIEHLKSLSYVKEFDDTGLITPEEFRKSIRLAERTKSYSLKEAKEITAKWKRKYLKK